MDIFKNFVLTKIVSPVTGDTITMLSPANVNHDYIKTLVQKAIANTHDDEQFIRNLQEAGFSRFEDSLIIRP